MKPDRWDGIDGKSGRRIVSVGEINQSAKARQGSNRRENQRHPFA